MGDGILAKNEGGNLVNCINRIDVRNSGSNGKTGGIVGFNDNGTVIDCVNYGSINGIAFTGGIAGSNGGTIQNCMSNAPIEGQYYVGGIAGDAWEGATISDCCNLGTVNSTGIDSNSVSDTGGIAGYSYGTVTRCINQGEITANYYAVGGIIGANVGTVSYCCNSGNVTGKIAGVGGIAGQNRKKIGHVYNIAIQIEANKNENGRSNVGGIVGTQSKADNVSDPFVRYSYNTAKIIGTGEYVAGIVGNFNGGTLLNVINTGERDTPSTANIGAIAGYKYDTSKISKQKNTTQADMKSWEQDTITTNLNNFIKKDNSLPILGITVRGITF